ncbi:LD-carboxypeptidase [candidate division CSSED10-310 bacterium]|uniref:LD-carboxypeptidase n=1 Tax=candidate division CSSED10-310 bacterium TaxID=2855610 RepID=A0ABV6YWX5_UNCC1
MLVKPRKLYYGDTIGVIAPGGPPDTDRLKSGIELLEELGFSVVAGASLAQRRGYLAGEDRDRAAELMAMFEDPGIDAIFCARGGTGSGRLLPYLDFEKLSPHPKIFVGYSDVTCLQLAFHQQMHWCSFYGPMVAVDLVAKTNSDIRAESVWFQMLTGQGPGHEVIQGKSLFPGSATGPLVGGCLSLIQSLCGSSYFPDLDGAILFLEEVNEEPYRIDRMLTHLKLCHHFENLAGVLVGELKDCHPKDDEPSLSIEQILADHFGPLEIPLIMDLPFGHGTGHQVLPIGVRAEMNGQEGYYRLLEKAVS